MTADAILLQVRSRLRDTNYQSLTFSDEEILDIVHVVQTRLVAEFDANIHTITATLTPKSPTLELETPVLKLIAARFEHRQISLTTHAQALREPPTQPTLIALSPTRYTIEPFAQGELDLSANLAPEPPELTTPMLLDPLYHRAVVLGSMERLCEIETNANNLERARVYQALFKAECDYLRALTNAAREKQAFTTPYTKI